MSSRIKILGVPVDVVERDELPDVINGLIEKEKGGQIIFLDMKGFFKARRKGEYRKAVNDAVLVLPVTARLQRVASFLKLKKPVIHKPFDFIIRVMGILERRQKSVYLIGSTRKRMLISQKNLKDSFPDLRFVGRYTGFYSKEYEDTILLGIKKAAPDFLLGGRGLKGKDLWMFRNRDKLNNCLKLWNKHCYEIFSGKRTKPVYTGPLYFFKALFKTIIMPWKFFLFFRFLYYTLLLLIQRIKGNRS